MGGRASKTASPQTDSHVTPLQRLSTQNTRRGQVTTRQSQKYLFIADQYSNVEQVTEALRAAGLESSNLIVSIDFTKSNEWTGKQSFNGQSLHYISSTKLNPYEQAISILGRTLSAFDDDNLIPCFGFGDVSTHDQYVFSFYPDGQPCAGFEGALARYKEIVPHLRLAGPTSFAPAIEAGIDIVEQSGGQYHVLVIVADGQVTRSVDTGPGRMSPQEQNTIEAIVAASDYALSIVLVGVGDGPWDMMKQFDDNIPHRVFDNFQFVNFTQIMSKNMPQPQKEASFALAALMEIPTQFRATVELGILNRPTGKRTSKRVLPPPPGVVRYDNNMAGLQHGTSFNLSDSYSSSRIGSSSNSDSRWNLTTGAPSIAETSSEIQVCPICLTQPKDLAFGCGHQTCRECGKDLLNCPLCRQQITTRLRLY